MYISEEALKEIVETLRIPGAASVFTNFLSLKYTGVNNESTIPCFDDKWKEDAYKSVLLLMSLYDNTENLPERYQLILPFEMVWRAQSISESAKSYARGRIKNNVDGGTPIWKQIVEINHDTEPPTIRFKGDYIQIIKQECKIEQTNKININKLSGWILRNQDIAGDFSSTRQFTKHIVRIFRELFNITPDEEREFFTKNGRDISYSENKTPMKYVRELIGPPPKSSSITSEKRPEYKIPQEIVRLVASEPSENPTIEVINEILSTGKQIILCGPPGTGKTYIAKMIGKKYFPKRTTFIQFHQNFGYEEFIGGIRPKNGTFKPVKGILTNLITEKATKNRSEDFLLIIDEINRGNISKIFGETIVCLDRDTPPVILAYENNIELQIPSNVFIIATMNTADRSIAFVDYALRRRFEFVYLKPDRKILEHYTDDTALEGISIVDLFSIIRGVQN